MNRNYDHELEVADAELGKVYKDAMTQASSARAKDALRNAERAWIKYRDSECKLDMRHLALAAAPRIRSWPPYV
jgi:uncharacterized protein YecT (DUF1311 family)